MDDNEIENGHQSNAHISHIPHYGVLRQASHKEHNQSAKKSYSRFGGRPVVSENVGNIGTGIEQGFPKKVEKLKSHKIIAQIIFPKEPKWYAIAVCKISIPRRFTICASGTKKHDKSGTGTDYKWYQ